MLFNFVAIQTLWVRKFRTNKSIDAFSSQPDLPISSGALNFLKLHKQQPVLEMILPPKALMLFKKMARWQDDSLIKILGQFTTSTSREPAVQNHGERAGTTKNHGGVCGCLSLKEWWWWNVQIAYRANQRPNHLI